MMARDWISATRWTMCRPGTCVSSSDSSQYRYFGKDIRAVLPVWLTRSEHISNHKAAQVSSTFLGHYLTMLGSTASIALVVAPALCLDIQSVETSEILSTLFFVSGLVTLIQTTVGIRLPIIQGGTFAFLVPTFAILSLPQWQCPKQSESDLSNETITNFTEWAPNGTTPAPTDSIDWKDRMRELQGAIITASLAQVLVGVTGIMGFILKFIGPLTIAPTVALIGMALFDVAASTCALEWGIAILTMALITLFSQYLRNVDVPLWVPTRQQHARGAKIGCRKTNYPVFKMFPVILGIVLSWSLCAILTVTNAFPEEEGKTGYNARTDLNLDVLYQAKWFRFPYPFQWGLPTFNIAGTLGMLAGVVAGMLESIGDYYACARLSGAPPPPVHAVNRGITVEGLGCIIAGMFGCGSGTTSYSENVGAIGITKVASRRVIQTAGCILMILGVFSKFGALFVTIPSPVVGGVFMVMFGMICAVGISNLQYVDLNSSRNLFIFGFAILVGLSVPKWLGDNPGIINTGVDVLDQIFTVMLSTSMFLGGSVAFILDNTVPGTREERGLVHWEGQLQTSQSQEDISTSTCYEIPLISRAIRRHTWTRHVPFLPTYKGASCSCTCACRKRKTDQDSNSDSLHEVTHNGKADYPTL